MNNAYAHTYDVEHMPTVVQIGRATETGVRELRFDASSWLRRWPDMEIAILPTAPGTPMKYPVVVRMDGTVAVWEISDSDTAQAGTGSVEIVGRCEGRQVVSASAAVIVLPRTPGTDGEAPDPARPWVDEVLDAAAQVQKDAEWAADAANRAEAAAERAESAGGGGGLSVDTDGDATIGGAFSVDEDGDAIV